MKKEIQFLRDLQKQMQYEDGHDYASQTSPRFWSLMDYKWVSAKEGEHERVSVYFYNDCNTVTLEDYVHNIVSDQSDEEYEEEDVLELKDRLEYNSEEDILEWIHEHDTEECYLIYEEEVSFIVPNTMFITRKEAKRHIELNKHNYTQNVHTYAMTAIRAPEVAHLFKLLKDFDWDKLGV